MANNIVELENRQEHLDQLKAARHLYTKVGNFSVVYMFFCVLIPVIISVGRILFITGSPIILQSMIAYSLAALVVGLVFESKINSNRGLAAKLQQMFDSEVLGFEWNTYLWGQKPSLDEINDNIGNLANEGLMNWYDPMIGELEKPEAVLSCQRTNLAYDEQLRKSFNNILSVIALIVGLVVLSVNFYIDEGIRSAIVFIGVPLVPIIKWFLVTRKQNLEDIKMCSSLKRLIDDKLDDLNASHGEIDYTIIYRIQDGIYSHRKVAYKIPDFFYNMTRNKHENSTHIIVGQIVDKLKRNKRRAECV